MSHTMTVKAVPNDDSDDVEWEISGEHESICRIWFPCSEKSCDDLPDPYEVDDDHPLAGAGDTVEHGVEHRHIEGEWMVLSEGSCALDYSDFANENLQEIAQAHNVGDVVKLDVDYLGDGEWHVGEITEATA